MRARVVLALLGAHLVGDVRAQLASHLPEGFALILLNPLQSAEPLPPERFVRATAAWIEGATEHTATWDVGAVLSTVADTADDELLGQILLSPPATPCCSAAPNSPPPHRRGAVEEFWCRSAVPAAHWVSSAGIR